MKKFIIRLSVIITVLIAALYITDTDYLIKAVRTIYIKGYTTAYLEDYKEFDNVIIDNDLPQPWPIHENYNTVRESESLVNYNARTGTVAYVIMMGLIKTLKPIHFQWRKVMFRVF
jgi:hypothetical protein